ncbi:MAG TPA: biosynthetic peptidoglycan transglycosylase [bacterium]|nr:biosynthetic peptidoglycan transglycosylase [bacterium]HPS31149.1 biosynthetic peptidoglycan transglycosylase [bacterium]
MTISPKTKAILVKALIVLFIFSSVLITANYIAGKIVQKAAIAVSNKISEKTDTETAINGPGYSIIPLKFTAQGLVVKKNSRDLVILKDCSVNNPLNLLTGKSRNIQVRCGTLSFEQSEVLKIIKEKAGATETRKSSGRSGSSVFDDFSIDMTIEKTAVKFMGSQESFWTNLKTKGHDGVLRIKGIEGMNSEGFLEVVFSIPEKKADIRFDNVSLKMFDKLFVKELRPVDYSGIVDGEVTVKKEGTEVSVSTDLTLLDIMVEHPLIDNIPYKLPFLRLESNAKFDITAKSVHIDESKFSIGGIEGFFEGSYGPEGKSLKLDIKNASLNKLETLVKGAVFKGFNLAGYIDFTMDYAQYKDEEPVFSVTGDVVDAKQISDRLDYLISTFQYSFVNDNGEVHKFTIGPSNDDYVPIAYLPEHVYWAVVISEDAGFFMHPGIDFNELGPAVLDNIKNKRLRGGSTITQQLAKNLFLNRNKTLIRKFQEMLLAVELDATFSKNRLLEIYMNIIEWAPGIFGISQAAYYYFGKTAYELTPLEAAYLASVIPGPYKYHYQFLTGNVNEKWVGNLHRILNIMQENGHITFEQYIDALGEVITFREKK